MKVVFDTGEKRFIGGVGFILAARTLGFSLIVPVFSIFSTGIVGSSEILAGVAVGIYGFTQTIFQIPMGKLSDVWGRKQATILGLVVFCIGTVICGHSHNIWQLIVGRTISGAGAVSGVTMAWLTDGIDPGKRNSALAIVGVSIGLSVIAAFSLSPFLAGTMGIPFLFHISAAFIFALIVYIVFFLKNLRIPEWGETSNGGRGMISAIKNPDLLRLNYLGLSSNLCLVSIFFIMPILIVREIPLVSMWSVYVAVAVAGTAAMFYFSKKADHQGTVKITVLGLCLSIVGAIIPLFLEGLGALVASFVLFYAGYCVLQPVLPAAVSRYPDGSVKGAALGLFNSYQFTGSGLGGVLGGFMLQFDHRYLFGILAIITAASLLTSLGFREFKEKSIT